jgi:hypothetical protein
MLTIREADRHDAPARPVSTRGRPPPEASNGPSSLRSITCTTSQTSPRYVGRWSSLQTNNRRNVVSSAAPRLLTFVQPEPPRSRKSASRRYGHSASRSARACAIPPLSHRSRHSASRRSRPPTVAPTSRLRIPRQTPLGIPPQSHTHPRVALATRDPDPIVPAESRSRDSEAARRGPCAPLTTPKRRRRHSPSPKLLLPQRVFAHFQPGSPALTCPYFTSTSNRPITVHRTRKENSRPFSSHTPSPSTPVPHILISHYSRWQSGCLRNTQPSTSPCLPLVPVNTHHPPYPHAHAHNPSHTTPERTRRLSARAGR